MQNIGSSFCFLVSKRNKQHQPGMLGYLMLSTSWKHQSEHGTFLFTLSMSLVGSQRHFQTPQHIHWITWPTSNSMSAIGASSLFLELWPVVTSSAMGVRGLLSYILRHTESTTQQVDLAQEARHGRHGASAVLGNRTNWKECSTSPAVRETQPFGMYDS